MAKYAFPEVLVSTAWVDEHRHDPGVRLVEADEDVLLYSQGHIAGAVRLDWHTDLQNQTVRDFLDKPPFRTTDERQRHRQRYVGRVLWRQKQLVGLLRLLGV